MSNPSSWILHACHVVASDRETGFALNRSAGSITLHGRDEMLRFFDAAGSTGTARARRAVLAKLEVGGVVVEVARPDGVRLGYCRPVGGSARLPSAEDAVRVKRAFRVLQVPPSTRPEE